MFYLIYHHMMYTRSNDVHRNRLEDYFMILWNLQSIVINPANLLVQLLFDFLTLISHDTTFVHHS